MAEYGREQRNQLSRTIANSGDGSRQLKGFVDNRLQNIYPRILQKKPGLLSCDTTINYIEKGKEDTASVSKVCNDASKAASNLAIIAKHPQTKWIADCKKKGNGNEAGVCAEPNSLAAALYKIDEKSVIKAVTQTPSVFVHTKTIGGKVYNPGDRYPPCLTCQQWVPYLYQINMPLLEDKSAALPLDLFSEL